VALFAEELSAVPLEEVVGGAADAGGGGEGAEALFAALLLIEEGPAEAEEREDEEEPDLQDVCEVGQGRVNGQAEICAEEKGEEQDEGCLGGEEELALEPVDPSAGRGLLPVATGGGGEGDEDYEGDFKKETLEFAAEMKRERMPTSVVEKRDESGEQAEAEEGCEAEGGCAIEGAAPAIGAEPEGVAGEADGETGEEGLALAALMAGVPELGLPGAGPVFAFVSWDDSLNGVEERAIEERQGRRKSGAHACFSGTRRARSGYLCVAASAVALPSCVT